MIIRVRAYQKKLYIRSQSADPAPPLGTVLGNLGVNSTNFCMQFNNYTRNLPIYYKLATIIYISENRSFTFSVLKPHIGIILNLLKFDYTIKLWSNDRFVDKTISCVLLYETLKLTKWKFGILTEAFYKIVLSVIKAHNIIVVRDRANISYNLVEKIIRIK